MNIEKQKANVAQERLEREGYDVERMRYSEDRVGLRISDPTALQSRKIPEMTGIPGAEIRSVISGSVFVRL
jgi:hypothetical protein